MTTSAGEDLDSIFEQPQAPNGGRASVLRARALIALMFGRPFFKLPPDHQQQPIFLEFAKGGITKAYSSALSYLVVCTYVASLACTVNQYPVAGLIFVLGAISAGIRISLPSRFDETALSNSATRRRAHIELVTASVCGSLAWAISLTLVYPLLPMDLRAILLVLVVGSVTVGASFMSLAPPALVLHLTIFTTAFTVGSLVQPTPHSTLLSALLVLFSIELFRTTYHNNVSSLRLASNLAQASKAHASEQNALQAKLMETQSRTETTLRASAESRNLHMAKISHEFRTPLQSIVASVDLLNAVLAKNPDPRVATTLQILNTASNQLRSSSNDLAEYLRTNSTHIKIKSEPVELIAFLQSCVSLHNAHAQKKGLPIFFTHTEPAIDYLVDSARLRQIMTNMLSNAVKYTNAGRIDLICQRESDGSIQITVADTGVGISEQGQKHIFEPWFRADDTKQGLGLGLAILKATADAIGAKIQMHSSLGVGTAMTVILPPRKVKSTA